MVWQKGGEDMAVYLISYDLDRPLTMYDPVIEVIQSIGPAIRPLISVWLVATEEEVTENISLKFRNVLKPKEKLFVSRVVDYSFFDTFQGPEVKAFIDQNF